MIAFEDAKITKYFVFMGLILGFTKTYFVMQNVLI
jgi:hypothetical protein